MFIALEFQISNAWRVDLLCYAMNDDYIIPALIIDLGLS